LGCSLDLLEFKSLMKSSADGQFPVTRWSVVLEARGDGQSAAAALADLCEAYWYPLYCFVRRKGRSPEDAEDLTQAFFGRLIEKDILSKAQEDRGKLRTFLLTSLKNFLSDEWDKATALKRGGGMPLVSIDAELAEERYRTEPMDESSPDRLFEKRWALTLLERVMTSLREQYEKRGKGKVFEQLSPFLGAKSGVDSYSEIARNLGISENAVRVSVFRLRQRYSSELRSHIAETVDSDEEVAAEIQFLFKAVQ